MRVLLVLTLLAAFSSRCQPATPADEPVKTYLDFVRAVRKRELTQAYAGLSTETRALLEKRAQELSAASGGALKADPMSLFFSAPGPAGDVSEVKLLEIQGNRATLSARSAEQTQTVTLVKEAGGWKVDLTQALRP